MNNKKTWIFAAILLVVAGLVVVQMFKTTISPENMILSEAAVSESVITLKGDLASSAIGYKSYSAEAKDGKLYVKLKGSTFNLTQSDGSFAISIDNKFGEITEVYLQGDSSSDHRLIWPQK